MRRLPLILLAIVLGLLALAACEKDYVNNVTVVDECCPDCGRGCDSTQDTTCTGRVDTILEIQIVYIDTCLDSCGYNFGHCYWSCIEECQQAGHAATCDCWRECAMRCRCEGDG